MKLLRACRLHWLWKSEVAFQTKYFVQKELDIRGSRNALPADFRAVINYMKAGTCPVEELITKVAVPEDALESLMTEWAVNPEKYCLYFYSYKRFSRSFK